MIRRINDKIFYGWVMVVASMVIGCALMGIRLSYGVFFKSLQGDFELSRAVTSSVYSAYMIGSAVLGILTGWVLDRYGPRVTVSLMGLFTGLSLLLTSQTTYLWQLFPSYSLLLAIGTAAPMPILTATVARWFDKKRGTATGITGAGQPLGTLIMAPFAAYLVSNLSWRMSFIVIGLIIWLMVIPLAMLLRRDPGEIGALPDGAISGAPRIEPMGMEESRQLSGPSLPQALGTGNFWLMLAILLLDGFSLSLILVHVVPYSTDIGISTVEAATVLSVFSGSAILARLLVGRISDTIGRKIPGIVCGLLGTVAFIWLISSYNLPMLYLFAVIFGFSTGGLGIVRLTLMSDIFAGRHLGMIMGIIVVGFSIGSAVGSTLGGYIFDVTGTYVSAFASGAVAMLMIALIYTAFTRQGSNTEVG
ncbi:MFS transporter [Chloroflexota bacterium]